MKIKINENQIVEGKCLKCGFEGVVAKNILNQTICYACLSRVYQVEFEKD